MELRQAIEAVLEADPRGFGTLLDWREEARGTAATTRSFVAVTDAGQKVRITVEVNLLVGPDIAGPERLEAGAAAPVVLEETGSLAPLEPEVPASSAPIADAGVELDRVERFPGADGRWYFHGVATNGEIVYPSQGYESKRNAGRPARTLADRFGVEVLDLDHNPRG